MLAKSPTNASRADMSTSHQDGTSDAAGKQPFLVCYDYGMGGLWGVMMARSEDEIRVKYPELVIVTERPSWMTDEIYHRTLDNEMHDIDGVPWGMLNGLIAARQKRGRGTDT